MPLGRAEPIPTAQSALHIFLGSIKYLSVESLFFQKAFRNTKRISSSETWIPLLAGLCLSLVRSILACGLFCARSICKCLCEFVRITTRSNWLKPVRRSRSTSPTSCNSQPLTRRSNLPTVFP